MRDESKQQSTAALRRRGHGQWRRLEAIVEIRWSAATIARLVADRPDLARMVCPGETAIERGLRVVSAARASIPD
jgi:hypothetical protein